VKMIVRRAIIGEEGSIRQKPDLNSKHSSSPSLFFLKNTADGIGAHKLITCRLWWPPGAEPGSHASFFNW
jgi:hypothetical protein